MKSSHHNRCDIAAKDYRAIFSQWFCAYHKKMLHLARCYAPIPDTAEDIVAGIWEKVWKHREKMLKVNTPKSYLCKMVKNRCIDESRHAACQPLATVDEEELQKIAVNSPNPETQLLLEEECQIVKKSLQTLSKKCRLVYLKVIEEGLNHKDAAETLGVSIKTIEKHLSCARKQIRVYMEKCFKEKE